jgi:hypothetical protein
MSGEEAEVVAVEALAFIAADAKLLGRFLMFTGLRPESIRLSANEPGFLPGVLGFVVGHEPDLLAFASEMAVRPDDVHAAAITLGAIEEA